MKKLIVLRGILGMLYAIPDILHGAGITGWESIAPAFEDFRKEVESLYRIEVKKSPGISEENVDYEIKHMKGRRNGLHKI